jgi:hypothetical protein
MANNALCFGMSNAMLRFCEKEEDARKIFML